MNFTRSVQRELTLIDITARCIWCRQYVGPIEDCDICVPSLNEMVCGRESEDARTDDQDLACLVHSYRVSSGHRSLFLVRFAFRIVSNRPNLGLLTTTSKGHEGGLKDIPCRERDVSESSHHILKVTQNFATISRLRHYLGPGFLGSGRGPISRRSPSFSHRNLKDIGKVSL